MSGPAQPPRPTGAALRRASWPGSEMRIGDAERTAIADRLARHFSDGRLDEAEFSDRLDRAMRATTMADLTGLLADLPEDEPVPLVPQRVPVSGRQQRRMLAVQLERERLRLRQERRQLREATRQQRARTVVWLAAVVGLAILGLAVLHALTHSVVAWLVLGVIALVWLLRSRGRGGYRGG